MKESLRWSLTDEANAVLEVTLIMENQYES